MAYSEVALFPGIAHHSFVMSTFGRKEGTEVGLHSWLVCAVEMLDMVDLVGCFFVGAILFVS